MPSSLSQCLPINSATSTGSLTPRTKIRSDVYRYKKVIEEKLTLKQAAQAEDKFMGKIYQLVKTHRDSEDINLQMDRINAASETLKLKTLAVEWSAIADTTAGKDNTLADCLEQLLRVEFDARTQRT